MPWGKQTGVTVLPWSVNSLVTIADGYKSLDEVKNMLTYGWGDPTTPKTAQRAGHAGLVETKQPENNYGFFTKTKVACNAGWRRIDQLSVGDKVLTFDHGMQPIVEIRKDVVFEVPAETPPADWPVVLPVAALGNRETLVLQANQGVMLEIEGMEDPMGDPFAVVPACALTGLRGISRAAPKMRMEMIRLVFASDEVIYVNGCMLAYCPRTPLKDAKDRGAYTVLSHVEAISVLKHADLSAQLPAQPGSYVFGATDVGLVA
jgi:hypothetical protein